MRSSFCRLQTDFAKEKHLPYATPALSANRIRHTGGRDSVSLAEKAGKDGRSVKDLVLYIHGKGGNVAEAEHYKPLFAGADVVGLSYRSQTPWEAKEEFPPLVENLRAGHGKVTLIANSIGAFFAMNALSGRQIDRALFLSPIVDMEKLIRDMMAQANVTEADLRQRREIPTESGETLSWAYLTYVRSNPTVWQVPTSVLYGERDFLTSQETISAFAEKCGATLTIVPGGEHWFHTEEQMRALDAWICAEIGR